MGFYFRQAYSLVFIEYLEQIFSFSRWHKKLTTLKGHFVFVNDRVLTNYHISDAIDSRYNIVRTYVSIKDGDTYESN